MTLNFILLWFGRDSVLVGASKSLLLIYCAHSAHQMFDKISSFFFVAAFCCLSEKRERQRLNARSFAAVRHGRARFPPVWACGVCVSVFNLFIYLGKKGRAGSAIKQHLDRILLAGWAHSWSSSRRLRIIQHKIVSSCSIPFFFAGKPYDPIFWHVAHHNPE